MARKAGAGKSLEKSEKRGVEAASKVTKRRAIPGRNHLGCRDLQAAIPDFATLCQPKYSQRPVALLTHVPHIFRK